MDVEYIIVQAGGMGTRLGRLTNNKPKCLVSADNVPILFHLFHQFPEKRFIIIGDYRYEVLKRYLETFAEVPYLLVRSEKPGNCAGISPALEFVPDSTPFMLIWSDLILGKDTKIDNIPEFNYIGISEDFKCRWSFNNGVIEEIPSTERGIAGVFIFKSKKILAGMPGSGEFAGFLANSGIELKDLSLKGTREIGTFEQTDAGNEKKYRCRSFNHLEISDEIVIKIPLNGQGEALARRELAWYKEIHGYKFKGVPEILSWEPFTMRRVKGRSIYRADLDDVQKKTVIDKVVVSLESLHGLKSMERDVFSIHEAYYIKTIKRLEKVRELIPFADQKTIVINDKPCRNIYFCRDELRNMTAKLSHDTVFSFIHGDCTFSNAMIDDNLDITFLDPRGYFGFTGLYGDTAYDWAKVFYSLNGDYDQFNNGNFNLTIGDDSVALEIAAGGWKHLSGYFLAKIPYCSPERIRFIHAIIWLSLTTYVWEDYDSVCGAFYNGLLLMDEFLGERKI
jgi:GTP:adenosylcobinamide-phosphate guanylyltransferase